jgi:hypothetical protein
MSSAKSSHGTNDGQKKRPNRALGKTKEKNHVHLPPFLASLLLFFFPKLTQNTPPQNKHTCTLLSPPLNSIHLFIYFSSFLLLLTYLLSYQKQKKIKIRPFTQKFWPEAPYIGLCGLLLPFLCFWFLKAYERTSSICIFAHSSHQTSRPQICGLTS